MRPAATSSQDASTFEVISRSAISVEPERIEQGADLGPALDRQQVGVEEAPTGHEHAPHLTEEGAQVGIGVRRLHVGDHVERGIVDRQVLGVAHLEADGRVAVRAPAESHRLRGEVDT